MPSLVSPVYLPELYLPVVFPVTICLGFMARALLAPVCWAVSLWVLFLALFQAFQAAICVYLATHTLVL